MQTNRQISETLLSSFKRSPLTAEGFLFRLLSQMRTTQDVIRDLQHNSSTPSHRVASGSGPSSVLSLLFLVQVRAAPAKVPSRSPEEDEEEGMGGLSAPPSVGNFGFQTASKHPAEVDAQTVKVVQCLKSPK